MKRITADAVDAPETATAPQEPHEPTYTKPRLNAATWERLTAFKARDGEYNLQAVVFNHMSKPCEVTGWLCSLEYDGITIDGVRGNTPETAIFLAFEFLHMALPESEVKW